MVQDLKKHFEEARFKPRVKPLSFFQDDYNLMPENGEEDGDADEDEEDEDDEDDEGDEEGIEDGEKDED